MFEWDDFLAVAEELAVRGSDEALARTAISRAYYAAFHAGRGYLNVSGIPLDTSGRTHWHVRQALGARAPTISEELRRLHEWRKEADYENPCSFDVRRQAGVSVALARAIIGMIRDLE